MVSLLLDLHIIKTTLFMHQQKRMVTIHSVSDSSEFMLTIAKYRHTKIPISARQQIHSLFQRTQKKVD